jgi:hypothetical protein
LFVAVAGLAYLGLPVSLLRRLLGVVMGVAGIAVILLSHVRSALVVAAGCAVTFSIIMIVQRRVKTLMSLAFFIAICGVAGLFYAERYGGQSTIDRFETLLADDPVTVYGNSARLDMVRSALDTTLLEHPLGAGLGRWGMMRKYFGDESNFDSPEIWAEVQFMAWVLDGGVVLLSLYVTALAVAVHRLIRSSFSYHSQKLRQWGAVVIMLSAGPIAFIFSYCPFYSQIGMQFWLLMGAFEGLVQGENHPLAGCRRHERAIISSQRLFGAMALATTPGGTAHHEPAANLG